MKQALATGPIKKSLFYSGSHPGNEKELSCQMKEMSASHGGASIASFLLTFRLIW